MKGMIFSVIPSGKFSETSQNSNMTVDALPAAENNRFMHCRGALWENGLQSHWIPWPWYFTEGIWSLHYYICTAPRSTRESRTHWHSDFPMSSPQHVPQFFGNFRNLGGDSLGSHHSRNPNLWKNSMVRLYLAMTPPRHQAPVKSGTQLLRQSSLQNFHQPIILPTQFGRRRWPFAEMSLKSLKPFTPPKVTWIPKIAAKYLNPEIYV